MQTRRILIVDDAPEFSNLVKDALSTLDIPLQISVYLSGEEAWLEALKTRFDLVITDLRLPGISGTELVRRIRARFPRIKIIAVSGLAEAGLDDRTRAAGVDAFYRKPVEIPLLLTKIDNLLSDLSRDMVQPESKPAQNPSISSKVTMPLTLKPEMEEQSPDRKKAEAAAATSTPVEAKPITPVKPVESKPVESKPAESKPVESKPEKKADGTAPDDETIIRDMEQRLTRLMKDCDADGVAISTLSGRILFSAGSAEKNPIPAALISGCAGLVNVLKKTEKTPEDGLSLGLASFSTHTFEVFVSYVSRFLIWLVFPSGIQPAEAAAVTKALYTSKGSLQFILNMLSQLPDPDQPPIAESGIEPKKGIFEGMNTDELKMPQELPGKSIDRKDADAFWDAEPENSGETILPDTITFDKAASLGLLPADKKEK